MARSKPKLSSKQRTAIKTETGTLRQIGTKYGVHWTVVGRIRRGLSEPLPKKAPLKTFTTPVGTVVKAALVSPRYGTYVLELKLSARNAAPLVGQIEEAIRAKLAIDPDAMRTDYKVYETQEDGSVVFKFRRSFTAPTFMNVAGNRLRKPERITRGRRVAVVYLPITRNREPEPFEELRYPGVGVMLVLEGVVLLAEQPKA